MKVRVWRAAYSDGTIPPRELEAGFLIERFEQTPWDLGLIPTRDIGYLYRCLEAVHVWRAAKKLQGDWSKNPRSITDEEWRTIAKVQKAALAQVAKEQPAVSEEL